jgi:nitrogen fixation NifU-like protein
MRDLYRELILDHSRNPRHFGRMQGATHIADGINPLCGDKLRLYLRVGAGGMIEASSFEGSGCAISMASASLLTDAMAGLSVTTAERWFDEITTRLTQGANGATMGAGLERFTALDGVREFPGRIKCATLAWQALHAALRQETSPATTE